MAHLFGTQNLKALGGSRIILDGINVSVEDGDRIGILGSNGAGKSTLLGLLSGVRKPDGGALIRRDGVEVAFLTQRDPETDATVLEVIHPGKEAHEWASNALIRDIHAGLLADVPLDKPFNQLSGGQRRRVSLAKVLSQGLIDGHPAEVLILDEPTNHLDVEGVAWLAGHLNLRFGGRGNKARQSGALLVVTHDRWFLDEVCTHVWEVIAGVDPGKGKPQIPGRIEVYEGSYAAYVLARAERARLAEVAAAKRENLLRKELAWLRRGAPARTSKPRFRIDAAEALIANEPPPRDEVELVKMATARLGKDVLDLENVSLAFADGQREKVIFSDVTYRLAPAERVGIVGVNGAGKTTLLRLLSGVITPDKGRVKQGKTVSVAVLSQDTHELDEIADLRVVEAVNAVAPSVVIGGKDVTASQLVERIGFTKERAWTPVADISGGERRRLQLVRLLMSEPNVILLDEPTNDLDTDTLAAMEDLLDSFPGTLVVVSHDRYLLERVTSHQLALLGDGKLRHLPGGVDEYLRLRANLETSVNTSASGATETAPTTSKTSTAKADRAAQKEMQKLERQIDKLATQIAEVDAKLADVSAILNPTAADIEIMTELVAEAAQLRETHEELEMRWLELAE
ncbi:ABC transporter, ATP-binding protein [Gleimia coleocanis DSM 15436]|uniref:ABC transporter, ATP-binding protein n=1 Tax=Gleimia coleocanis DSM 15436 TaxID=525245 RepID=C0W0Y5_9ACTO|nr:ABC-F family ATP-binding cassette domain-containing protein [Gleimia coleocanis]EEH63709.1 ABC transporter, ATP-binding protein [Gleimia coleocanis DSM 15436]